MCSHLGVVGRHFSSSHIRKKGNLSEPTVRKGLLKPKETIIDVIVSANAPSYLKL